MCADTVGTARPARFSGLAISGAEISTYNYFSKEICAAAVGNCCGLKLAKCRDSSFLNINFIVLFIAIFGALSLPVVAVLRLRRWTGQRARHAGGGGTVAVVPVSGRGRAVLAAARPR